jgi:hypothetical protein
LPGGRYGGYATLFSLSVTGNDVAVGRRSRQYTRFLWIRGFGFKWSRDPNRLYKKATADCRKWTDKQQRATSGSGETEVKTTLIKDGCLLAFRMRGEQHGGYNTAAVTQTIWQGGPLVHYL